MKALALAAAFTVPLGGSIDNLQVAPDGAAWVHTYRNPGQQAVRVAPDGVVRTTEMDTGVVAAAIGPEGQAWFMDSSGGLQRVDASGARTVPRRPGIWDFSVAYAVAPGPDGVMWTVTTRPRIGVLRLTPGDQLNFTRVSLPGCDATFSHPDLVRAADGAVWVSDWECDRLVRIAPDGSARAIPLTQVVLTDIAPDPAGGVWFSALSPLGGHVSAAGDVTLLRESTSADGERWGVAIAPDGRPWFATGTCTLQRVDATGALERHPAPIPARELAFAPTGRLWLASETRVAHADAPPSGCDDRPPRARITTGGTLRRGVRISVDEAATLRVDLSLRPGGDVDRLVWGPAQVRTVRAARGRSLRVRLPAEWPRLTRGDEVTVSVHAIDRDGNDRTARATLTVRR